MSSTDDFAAWQAKRFEKNARKVAAALRDAADDIERSADRVQHVGTGKYASFSDSYSWVAHEVVDRVGNLMPNLSLGGLTLAAHEADDIRTNPPA
jgi:hypothetical protein